MVNVKTSKMPSAVSSIGGVEACGARWTLGALLLAPLAAANSSYCAVLAVMLLGFFSLVATFTCRDLKQLATILPPPKTSRGRRERNLRSFGDFMAMWMTFLSHLVAVAICARILSATADHVTDGRTRRWLFGYETRALGEPWPDVLGVTVVLVVCAMFMCGLEENFTFKVMLMIFLYLFTQFFAIFGLLHLDIANVKIPFPITIYELFAAGAPISYAFCVALPNDNNTQHNLKNNIIFIVGLPTLVLLGLCFFYTNMLKGNSINAALPVTTLLEARSADWMCPILAAVTVSGVCLALTDLCPLLFNILVSLASPEWKVLTRSMTYESATTGSPVLAVFTAGSLAAILAFACPLAHMITLMNASYLIGITMQAFHFIIMRCIPTAEQKEAGDVEYKRLGNEGTSNATKPAGVKQKGKRGLWFIPSAIRHTKTLESIKSKMIKETEERECLLLDEYSGCATDELEPTRGSATMATPEIDDVASDIEVSEPEISSGDDSTDIDAVVKEYRDTIQVVTSTPEASIPQPPSVHGARWSAVGAVTQILADALIAVAFCNEASRLYMYLAGIPLWVCSVFLSAWQPAHALSMRRCQSIQGSITMLIALLLLTPLLIDSWPAILLFAGAGVVIYARCERWCGDLAVSHARNSLKHRKLRPVSSAVPIAGTRLAHIDTVYITR